MTVTNLPEAGEKLNWVLTSEISEEKKNSNKKGGNLNLALGQVGEQKFKANTECTKYMLKHSNI